MQTCLIVDNSKVICKVASRIIFQMGFEVESVATVPEALQKFQAGDLPDILIVSATLTEVPGEDLVRAVRAMRGGAQPVILASLIESNLGLMTRFKRAGVTGFIYKPFDRLALTGWLQPYRTQAEVA